MAMQGTDKTDERTFVGFVRAMIAHFKYFEVAHMSWIDRLHDIKAAPGEAVAPVFDTSKWKDAIASLVKELADKDPRSDCWEWVLTNRPELWRDLVTATGSIDKGFAKRDADAIAAAIKASRELFGKCIESWQAARVHSQGDLFA